MASLAVIYVYMDDVFELVAHKESEIWTSLPYSFTKEGILYRYQVGTVCVASV